MKKLKGRTSRRIQEEFPHISKKYWGRHFWAIGYGVWSTGNITDEMVQKYLEHHRTPETFYVPPEEIRRTLKAGDVVKLPFEVFK